MKNSLTERSFGAFALGLLGMACAAPAERSHDQGTGGSSEAGGQTTASGGESGAGGTPEMVGGQSSTGGSGGLSTGGRGPDTGGSGGGGPRPGVCGNGVRELGEPCDDGNVTGGDGCSWQCRVEQGFYCPEAGPCLSLYGNPACPVDSCQLGAACVIPASHTTCECPDAPLGPCESPVFLGLGYLPDANECAASGISADGTTIVGTCNHVVRSSQGGIESQAPSAVSWRLGTDQRPQRLVPDSPYSTYGLAVNQDGTVAAGAEEDAQNAWRGFIVAPSLLTRFDDDGAMVPAALSADGSVLVGTLGEQAFRYSVDSGLALVVDERFPVRMASGVSADGTISVGAVEEELGRYRAARWNSTGPVELLPVPADATASAAASVSADGTVVVGNLWFGDQETRPVRWTSLGMEVIAERNCGAIAASADGRVIVGNCPFTLWIWDEAHGLRDLTALLEELGVDLTDWGFNGSVSVSADGLILAGTAQYIGSPVPGSGMRAFVVWLPE